MSFYATGDVPSNYRCSKCDAHRCKLWRQYQTFADNIRLMCGTCALADQKKTGPIDEAGYREGRHGRTDQIGWLVPAVPDEENATFWGYTSVPAEGVAWWRALPTAPSATTDRGGKDGVA